MEVKFIHSTLNPKDKLLKSGVSVEVNWDDATHVDGDLSLKEIEQLEIFQTISYGIIVKHDINNLIIAGHFFVDIYGIDRYRDILIIPNSFVKKVKGMNLEEIY